MTNHNQPSTTPVSLRLGQAMETNTESEPSPVPLLVDRSAFLIAGQDVPPKPYHELICGDKVRIYTGQGKDRKLFKLEEDLLCHRVKYFAKAFRGGWKEGETKTLELDDVDTVTFTDLVDWIFGDKFELREVNLWEPVIKTDPAELCQDAAEMADDHSEEEPSYMKLYALAERLDIPDLKSRIAQSYQERRTLPTTEDIELVYVQTFPRSEIRKAMVEMVIRQRVLPVQHQDPTKVKMVEKLLCHDEFSLEVESGYEEHESLTWAECIFGECKFHPWKDAYGRGLNSDLDSLSDDYSGSDDHDSFEY